MKKEKTKKKTHKTAAPHYHVHTYGQGKNPFKIEWFKYFNPIEGRDQIMFIYESKETGDIVKHRILR